LVELQKQCSAGIAAIIAALVAIVALIGIKFQADASYRLQREQSAKEIYRELLNISIAQPWQVQLLSGLAKIEDNPYVISGDFDGQHFSEM
jgi:hypothetical protein